MGDGSSGVVAPATSVPSLNTPVLLWCAQKFAENGSSVARQIVLHASATSGRKPITRRVTPVSEQSTTEDAVDRRSNGKLPVDPAATTITVGRLADGGVQPQVAVDGAEAFT